VPNTWGYQQLQEYMGDDDDVDQVEEEDDGIVEVGGA